MAKGKHFVKERSETPDGIKIQIEDWSDAYPSIHTEDDTIGFYPISYHDIWNGSPMQPYPRMMKEFRASFRFPSKADAYTAFDQLKRGTKTIMDFIDYYEDNVIKKENFIAAITK